MTNLLKNLDISNSEMSKSVERMSAPLSIVYGINTEVKKTTSVKEFLETLQRTDEEAMNKRNHVRTLANENHLEYQKLKGGQNSSLCGFIPGTFSKRNDNSCEEYLSLLVFDIDGVSSIEDTLSIVGDAAVSPFIFAAFPSPSYKGVRILVWTNSNPKTHKHIYQAVSNHLSAILSIPTDKELRKTLKSKKITVEEIKVQMKNEPHIDSSTSNISRHFYYTPVGEDIYLNVDSQNFIVSTKQSIKNDFKHISEILPKIKKELLEKIGRQRGKGRNCTTFEIACMFFENGISEADTLSYCLNFEELNTSDRFDATEIERAVKSAYKSVSDKNGINKYSDAQFVSYANSMLGETVVKSLLGENYNSQNMKKSTMKIEIDEADEHLPNIDFPIHCLPPKIKFVIEEMNKAYQLPVDFYGLSVLTVCSGIIGNNFKVKYKGYTSPAVIFSAIVGEVSMGKSPAIDFCFRPVYEINGLLLEEYKKAYSTWLETSDGEKPTFQKVIVQDATTEAINKNFINGSTGLIYYRDELMSWLNSMNQYKGQGSDEQFWLTAWNGKSMIIDRAGSQLPFDIKDVCISSIGSIQPHLLQELLRGNKKHNGFFSRILFAYPNNQKKPLDNAIVPDDSTLEIYSSFVKKLFENVRADKSLAIDIPMSNQAEIIYREWKNENTRLINDSDSPIIKGIYGKLDNYCIRIALVLELMFNISEKESFNPMTIEVSQQIVKNSIELTEYFRHTAHKVFDRAFNFNPIEGFDDDKQKLFYGLPDDKDFRRSEANIIGKKIGLSEKTVGRFLRNNPNLFRRRKKGIYTKRKIM